MMARNWQRECEALNGNQNLNNVSHQNYNLITPSSYCPHCQKKISACYNISLISFILLRGKCKACNAAIGWRYPTVEIISAYVRFGGW